MPWKNAERILGPDEERPDDFQIQHTKKLGISVSFMSDPNTPLTLLSSALATTPSTHLSNRLQHLDHSTGCSEVMLIMITVMLIELMEPY